MENSVDFIIYYIIIFFMIYLVLIGNRNHYSCRLIVVYNIIQYYTRINYVHDETVNEYTMYIHVIQTFCINWKDPQINLPCKF